MISRSTGLKSCPLHRSCQYSGETGVTKTVVEASQRNRRAGMVCEVDEGDVAANLEGDGCA